MTTEALSTASTIKQLMLSCKYCRCTGVTRNLVALDDVHHCLCQPMFWHMTTAASSFFFSFTGPRKMRNSSASRKRDKQKLDKKRTLTTRCHLRHHARRERTGGRRGSHLSGRSVPARSGRRECWPGRECWPWRGAGCLPGCSSWR